jgi:formylglycine-generating enzyme required for sulfatase activity/tetratricopeptide (TPR) repeat protein
MNDCIFVTHLTREVFMDEIVNPYIAGAPVTEKRMFFGREDVFDWIERSLSGQYADHILVVHGQRRVGKTSVLKQLGNHLPDRYIPVFFDLQGRTHTTLDRFMWWLAREIARVLKQERDITITPPDKELFTQDLEYFENRFLPELKPHLGEDKVLLLTFDEFDNLEEGEIKEVLARPLIDHLRRLMEYSNLNFIFSIGSSGRKLENMQAAYTEFFKAALYKKISFLTKDDGYRLITLPVQGILEYERDAVKQIYEIVSGHPYFTQLVCHELFSQCQKTGKRTISRGDVDAILDDVVERGTVNLKFVWDEANDLEKWALSGLAQLEGKRDNRAVADFLSRQRVRFNQQALDSALLHLREKDVLTEDNRFVNHLLQIWMKKNRPIEQAREELTEVNPIANRYIEIGLEFKHSGLHDKATESFKEALEIDSDNLQAQVNLALVYLDQKNVEKAIAEFEKALVIDEEDIATRSGLCDAYLAQGDQARAKGRPREAVEAYQKVLAFNAEHNEARQRMAEINCLRAEKALVDGKDEEALSAFTEALKYTPEDPGLIERVEQVRAEKKAKVLAALLARSDKEVGAKNWEGAIKSLEEALSLAPDDTLIQKKLSGIKVTQEKAWLDALLTKVDAAAKSARWDEAIETLTAVLAAKPDDAIETKLTEVRAKQREARLSELKTQALAMTRAERFDEALSAWEEYSALEPADPERAQAEIEDVKKAQALAKSYAEAQKAYAKKNYDKAVNLLKGIINQDENYKDASRLLAQAIELRRTAGKWWQSKRMRTSMAIFASTTVVLLAMVLLSNSNVLGSIRARFYAWVSSSNTPAGTEVATSASATTEVTTSTSAEQIRAFADPILTAIAKRSPVLDEDFSDVNSGWPVGSTTNGDKWGYTDEVYSLVVTSLYRNNSGAPCLDLSPNRQPQFSDFVLEVDAQFVSGTAGNWHLLLSNIQSSLLGSDNTYSVINFFPDGTFLFTKDHDSDQIDIVKGSTPSAFMLGTGTNQVTIIAQGTRMAAYINEEPLFLVNDATWQDAMRELSFGACNDAGKDSPLQVRFDNLKVWDVTDLSAMPPTPTPGIGSTMIGEDGATLVYVPEGKFTMGSYNGNTDEQPIHIVYLYGFWIDQNEVTNKQYAACVTAGKCDAPSRASSRTRDSYYDNSEFDDFPVTYVNWDNAKKYCEWAGERLPTEAEWEKTARGIDQRTYPWGNDSPNNGLLNFNNSIGDTTEVGDYPNGASPYGAFDMAGNVEEWVNDWYDGTYYENLPSFNPFGPDSSVYRVLRGGSWLDGNLNVGSANRSWNYPSGTYYYVGFRCALPTTLTPAQDRIAAPTFTPAPSSTQTPTKTPDAVTQLFTQVFSYIKSSKPAYTFTFDQAGLWGFENSPENSEISHGELVVTSGPRNRPGYPTDHWNVASIRLFTSHAIAVSFDFRIEGTGGEYTYCGFELRDNGNLAFFKNSYLFMPGGYVNLEQTDINRTYPVVARGKSNGDFTQTNSATIILLDTNSVVYVNEEMVLTYKDPKATVDFEQIGLSANGTTNGLVCHFDNLKAWELGHFPEPPK